MEDIKRYIVGNEQTDDARKEEALRALSLFLCPQVAENSDNAFETAFKAAQDAGIENPYEEAASFATTSM